MSPKSREKPLGAIQLLGRGSVSALLFINKSQTCKKKENQFHFILFPKKIAKSLGIWGGLFNYDYYRNELKNQIIHLKTISGDSVWMMVRFGGK